MSKTSESSAARQGGADSLKWVLVAVIVAVGVVGNLYFVEESLLYRVIALLVLAAIAFWLASTTSTGRYYLDLFKGARAEIRRVIWPTRPELFQTTAIVVVFVLVVGLFLWGLDSLISWLASMFIG